LVSILQLPSGVHRFLISSPCRFVGNYETPKLEIQHAWQGWGTYEDASMFHSRPSPYSRSYFVVAADFTPEQADDEKFLVLGDFSPFAERVCASLAVLFGKRFDYHGTIQTHGQYTVPSLSRISPVRMFALGPNNHDPRVDLSIPSI
jgi:hypothetical protein